MRELANIVLEHNLILILDEAYQFLVYDKALFSPMRIPELRKHIVLCKSFSKEFAMTGWRIGYVWADKETIAKIDDVHTYFSISPSTLSIVAATIALSDPRGELAMKDFQKKFAASRQAICDRLDKLPKLFSYHKPAGAYYTFPRIVGFDMPSLEFAKKLVDETKVITIPGASSGPGGEGHVRMSFAADQTLIHAAFDRIDDFASRYHLR